MSYADMMHQLDQAFESNTQKIKHKALVGVLDELLSIPALSGSSGIGKTACIKDFAQKHGFNLVKIDCSYEPANNLVARLNNAIIAAKSDKPTGTVLLLDFCDQADDDFLELLSQFRSNFLRASLRVAQNPTAPKKSTSLTYKTVELSHDTIPPEVFIVGEVHPD